MPASSPRLPALGVGITHSSAIEPLLDRHPDLVDVLEIEPQTTWLETRDEAAPYRISAAALDHIAQLPGRKIVHSIGAPAGGTVRPEPYQLGLLRYTIARLGAPWASEHLSFNSTREFRTGFFLPPRQTPQGVQTAVASIREIQAALPVPFAIETGVNYLRPRPDEMPDGAFVGSVIEAADCGLLLDLHNVFTNAMNGRQSVSDFLDQIPLDRVWEIHLAGGFEMDGFWLDAHSGAIPDPLYAIAQSVIPSLPNLKAIIFEMFPSFVSVAGLNAVYTEIERIHDLWSLRARSHRNVHHRRLAWQPAAGETRETASPSVWERALGSLVIGRSPEGEVERDLARDPGIRVVNRLIAEFRGSMAVTVLRLTSRFLMLTLGPDVFRAILEDFWSKVSPQQYAWTEAEEFAKYLEALGLEVPRLPEILAFERAVLATLIDDQPRVVRFRFDPLPLFRALLDGRLPDEAGQAGDFEIEVTPDRIPGNGWLTLEAARQTNPYH